MTIVNVSIEWKTIGFLFLAVLLLRLFLSILILSEYVLISKKMVQEKFAGMEKRILRIRRLCDLFSLNPMNKKTCLIYNGFCVFLASIQYLNGNEDLFLNYLSEIKREKTFDLKFFMISLFYLSKKDFESAKEWYNKFLICSHQDSKLLIVLDYLFRQKGNLQEIQTAAKGFQNPAIKKMLVDLNCPGFMQAEDNPMS